jgi:chromate reductase
MKKIVVITGSVRPGNYTAKAVKIVLDEIENTAGVEGKLINPLDYEITFPGLPGNEEKNAELISEIKSATAVILATPEYHGTFSSVMKLTIENMGFPNALSGKPVALMGVAAGAIGAIKSLEQLRGVCSHVGAIVLPGPVSVARVNKVFDEAGNLLDENYDKLLRGLVKNLNNYIDDFICPKINLEQIVRAEN